MALRIDELPGETIYVEVGRQYATGVHQVDSPVFGADGLLYCTMSGSRGNKATVPLYRIGADPRNDLALDDPAVSGQHLELEATPDGKTASTARAPITRRERPSRVTTRVATVAMGQG